MTELEYWKSRAELAESCINDIDRDIPAGDDADLRIRAYDEALRQLEVAYQTTAKLSKLFVFVGPSGSGKSTVTDKLQELYGYKPVWSFTTRPPRFPGEPNHTFVSQTIFDRIRNSEGLVAYTRYNGYDYGVPPSELDKCDTFVVEPTGVESIRTIYKNKRPFVVIGLTLSEEARVARMQERGDMPEIINRRIIQDRKSFDGFEAMCDYVVNAEASLDDVVEMVHEIIRRENA